MYVELRIIAGFFKLVAILQFTFSLFGIVTFVLNVSNIASFFGQLSIIVPVELLYFAAVALLAQAFIAAAMLYAQGQLIDVVLSMERSLLVLRSESFIRAPGGTSVTYAGMPPPPPRNLWEDRG
ncbi:MAG: hypothetical protein SF123_03005 [Chloroflexota bacterium]|nr:hypothetical protein [Chloroflexota bacterium]